MKINNRIQVLLKRNGPISNRSASVNWLAPKALDTNYVLEIYRLVALSYKID